MSSCHSVNHGSYCPPVDMSGNTHKSKFEKWFCEPCRFKSRPFPYNYFFNDIFICGHFCDKFIHKCVQHQQLSHPGGPSSRCPAWKMHTHFFSSLLTNNTYSNAAPVSLMFRVKRRACDWIILLRYTPPDGKKHTRELSEHPRK